MLVAGRVAVRVSEEREREREREREGSVGKYRTWPRQERGGRREGAVER